MLRIRDDSDAIGAEHWDQVLHARRGLHGFHAARHEVTDWASGTVAIAHECEEHIAFIENTDDAIVFVEHCHLRDGVHSHALNRLCNRHARREAEVFAFKMAARDEIANVTVSWSRNKSVVDHPEVVEHLREVLGAVVADERHHYLRRRLLAAVLQCCSEQRADGRACEHAFEFEKLARDFERLCIGDRIRLVDERHVENGRNEIFADAFDEP